MFGTRHGMGIAGHQDHRQSEVEHGGHFRKTDSVSVGKMNIDKGSQRPLLINETQGISCACCQRHLPSVDGQLLFEFCGLFLVIL